ncbi:MAG TPA: PLDc N-terminal domain-containing protein [Actinomycetota bacterium]|jgi:Phospholipase_D-nuclease N-terminal
MLAEWTLGTTLWTLLALFFWSMFLWMLITVFADIFRRRDLSGFGKAAWIFLIVILPFIGILIYMIARPSVEVVPPDGMMGVA